MKCSNLRKAIIIVSPIIVTFSVIAISIFATVANERNVQENLGIGQTSRVTQDIEPQNQAVTNNEYTNKLVSSAFNSSQSKDLKYLSSLLSLAYISDSHPAAPSSSDKGNNNSTTSSTTSIKYREVDVKNWNLSQEAQVSDSLSATSFSNPIVDLKMIDSSNFQSRNPVKMIISLSQNGDLNLFKCEHSCINSNSWFLVSPNFANAGRQQQQEEEQQPSYLYLKGFVSRPFDGVLEQSSGRLIITYAKPSTSSHEFYYRIFNSTNNVLSTEYVTKYYHDDDNDTLARSSNNSNEQAGQIRYFKTAAKSESDEIALAIDIINPKTSEELLYAFTWDHRNTKFENQILVASSINSSNSVPKEPPVVGISFEKSSGAVIVFADNSLDSIKIMRFVNGVWSQTSITDSNPNSHNIVEHVTLVPNPSINSDEVMACVEDDLFDLSCAEVINGHISKWFLLDSNMKNALGRHFDFTWNDDGTKGILVWTNSEQLNLRQWSEESKSWKNMVTKSYDGNITTMQRQSVSSVWVADAEEEKPTTGISIQEGHYSLIFSIISTRAPQSISVDIQMVGLKEEEDGGTSNNPQNNIKLNELLHIGKIMV